jgi:transaldolase
MNPIIAIDVFCDSADLTTMRQVVEQYPYIRGWTCNPSICRKCGVSDYTQFIRDALTKLPALPLSVEVVADDPDTIDRQARWLSNLARTLGRASTLYVKVPIVNSQGDSLAPTIRRLSQDGIQVNATAVLAFDSACEAANALHGGAPSWVSVFVGRLADAGLEPLDRMAPYLTEIHRSSRAIWASPREPLNVLQAQNLGFDAITVFHDFIKKLHIFGKDLREFEIETSRMFLADSIAAGYSL